jgi:hypothetical protein
MLRKSSFIEFFQVASLFIGLRRNKKPEGCPEEVGYFQSRAVGTETFSKNGGAVCMRT